MNSTPPTLPAVPEPQRAPWSPYPQDLEAVLATQDVNGGPWWTSPDGTIGKGGPYSTLEAGLILAELGVAPDHPAREGIATAIFTSARPNGAIRSFATGTIYPCQTANACRTLCYLGLCADPRLQLSLDHLMAIRHSDGTWRCNATKFGKGPESDHGNPGTTLTVLDVLRFTPRCSDPSLDTAVDFLLGHWLSRLPLGPCRFGIGTQFLRIEYPFLRYNLFHYLHTLSFYPRACSDPRFLDALRVLQGSLADGQIVVGQCHRRLATLEFCRPGCPSALAQRRYQEIMTNLGD